MLIRYYIFLAKVVFSRLLILAFSATNSSLIFAVFIFAQKVRKTPDFFRNSVFIMVAEAGLEPTTSGL